MPASWADETADDAANAKPATISVLIASFHSRSEADDVVAGLDPPGEGQRPVRLGGDAAFNRGLGEMMGAQRQVAASCLRIKVKLRQNLNSFPSLALSTLF
jgi:hypothetical protein